MTPEDAQELLSQTMDRIIDAVKDGPTNSQIQDMIREMGRRG